MEEGEDIYEQTRLAGEAERLEEQGRLWTINSGYHIHPSIATTLPSSPKIADVACGTGSYLIELAPTYPPDARLDGFDISSRQFRGPNTVPSNVDLIVADVKSPLPTKYHGLYDLVHIRLLVLGLAQDDWQLVAQNVFQLLKPGGFIQWEEADFANTKRLRGSPSHNHCGINGGGGACKLDHALQMMQSALVHRFAWRVDGLPAALDNVGFTGVFQDIFASDRVAETRGPFASMNLKSFIGWAQWMASVKKQPLMGEPEFNELVKQAEEEIGNGAYVRYEIYVTVGMKSPT